MAASARVVTMASDVSTNLLKLKASRKKPRPGDVFDTECRRSTQMDICTPHVGGVGSGPCAGSANDHRFR
jgi:hypothetical protein